MCRHQHQCAVIRPVILPEGSGLGFKVLVLHTAIIVVQGSCEGLRLQVFTTLYVYSMAVFCVLGISS